MNSFMGLPLSQWPDPPMLPPGSAESDDYRLPLVADPWEDPPDAEVEKVLDFLAINREFA